MKQLLVNLAAVVFAVGGAALCGALILLVAHVWWTFQDWLGL